MTLSMEISPVQRAFSAHTPKWQRFQSTLIVSSTQVGGAKGSKQQQFPYQRQYSHVYHQRLSILGPRCWDRIAEQMDHAGVTKVQRILELREDVLSVVVGALVKETVSEGELVHPESLCKSSDALYLEDESGRVSLAFSVETKTMIHEYPTGIVLGLKGIVGKDGVMTVDEVFNPKAPFPIEMASPEECQGEKAPHLLLLSGLNCGGSEVSSLPRDMLVSFLQGHFGTEKASCVSHIVVAGGLIHPEQKSSPTDALRDLDAFLLQVTASGLPATILPGKDDPTTANWPQRPMHSALLPRTSSHMGQLLAKVPNPYAAAHHAKLVVGTDGTNVKDLIKRTVARIDDKLAPVTEMMALRRSLEWSHICPTGPDSVPTMPHLEGDPMVLANWPSIYFSGNADSFATDAVQDENGMLCRLVCIPEFSSSGQAVLVNLETLGVEILRFEITE